MRHEEKWHDHGGNEVRGTLQARCQPHAQAIGLIKGIEQIHSADDVEHPYDDGSRPAPEHGDREEREYGCRKVPIGSGLRESGRQVRRDHTGTRNAKPTNRKA